jgi:anti-sigma factor RsiW
MEQRDCFLSEDELNLYIDKELPKERLLELEAHILSCPECEYWYMFANGLKESLRESRSSVTAPYWLREKILRDLQTEKPIRESRFWEGLGNVFKGRPLVPVSIAAALVVIFFAMILYSPVTNNGNMPFIKSLVHEHQEYTENPLMMGISSNNAQDITNWLNSAAGINPLLPSGDDAPVPEGACMLEKAGETIGYVYFNSENKRVSLFMLEDHGEKLFGQHDMKIENISVHCGNCTGMNYVLWKSNDLVCLLVADMPEEKLMKVARDFI